MSLKLPVITGTIRRRILVNYRVDPDVAQRRLPPGFRPKLQNGYAVVGICLIRLERVHPAFIPLEIGMSSENAAHRYAVEWEDEDGSAGEGVFIPRRDTDSRATHTLGGKLFPGSYNLATFNVRDEPPDIDFAMRSEGDGLEVQLRGRETSELPSDSIFPDIEAASRFFETGSLGYSARPDSRDLDALELVTRDWAVNPLEVDSIRSSYLEDPQLFPEGSAQFDCALIMRNLRHEWHTRPARRAKPLAQ